MVGNSKPHRTTAPHVGQLLCSPKSLEQSHYKHRLVDAPGGAILDLWETSLYGATQKLVQILCTGHNPAFHFLIPLTQGEKLGVSIYEEKANRKKWGAFKLVIGRMMSGLPSESSSINGPATWAEDGSWGHQTPIYMLNCIIQL
jgi:hypothetical protein